MTAAGGWDAAPGTVGFAVKKLPALASFAPAVKI
jgi:hypothetical protein